MYNWKPKTKACDLKGVLCSRNSMSETLRLVSGVQHPGSAGVYETTQHFMDIKEHLHIVKRDIDSLAQRSMVTRSPVSWSEAMLMLTPNDLVLLNTLALGLLGRRQTSVCTHYSHCQKMKILVFSL